MQKLIRPTWVMSRDSKTTNAIFTLLALLVAFAMFLAASGSGNPATKEPLPNWFNSDANVISVIIGLLVLLPKTCVIGSVAAAINMLLSMFVNYTVDGYAYFIQVLPFDLGVLMVALIVTRHYWPDLPDTFK